MYTQKILEFINDIAPYEEVLPESEFFDEGILDSLSLLVLIDRLETEFEIEIPIEDVTRQNFHNAAAINDLIGEKNGNGGDPRDE